MGKKCFVPHCFTGSINCEERFPFYSAPKDPFFLKRWQEAIAREDKQIVSNDSVCGKHFAKEDLILDRIVKGEVEQYKYPKLKPDAVPSIFDDPPELIPANVRRRRKLEAYAKDYQKNLREKWKHIQKVGAKDYKKNLQEKWKYIQKIGSGGENLNTDKPNKHVNTETDSIIESETEENLLQTGIIKNEIIIKSEVHFAEDYLDNDCPREENALQTAIVKEEIDIKSEVNFTEDYLNNDFLDKRNEPEKLTHLKKDEKKIIKSSISLKKSQSKSDIRLQCSHCSFEGKSKKALKLHTAKTHKSKKSRHPLEKVFPEVVGQLKCLKCDYVAENRNDLISHLYEHTLNEVSSRNFQKFSQKLEISENKNENLVCRNCDFVCSSKTELVAHNMLNHESFI